MKRGVVQEKDVTQNVSQSLVLEMDTVGATNVAIAKPVGVSDMTVLSVAKGKTKYFRKLRMLQFVYDRWKAGKLDLSGKRGNMKVETTVVEYAPVLTKATASKSATARKQRRDTSLNPQ